MIDVAFDVAASRAHVVWMISRELEDAAADHVASESSEALSGPAFDRTGAADDAALSKDDDYSRRNAQDDEQQYDSSTKLLDNNNHSASMSSIVVDKSSVSGAPHIRPHGTQVAPLPLALPRTEDFHAGKILDGVSGLDAAAVVAARQETEESYIPVALAKAHLAKVVADMHAMKDEQALAIAQIMERYKVIEHDTQVHYETLVSELKRKAKRKIETEQRKVEALEHANAEQLELAALDRQQLLAEHAQETRAHDQQVENCRAQLETALHAHEDAMAHCHVLVASELRRADASHQADKDVAMHALRNELLMRWEDAKSESARTVSQLDQLRKELLVKEKAFLRRVQQMQQAFDVERETFVCLSDVVNRVVDSAQQQTMQRTANALTTQLSALEREMQAAVARERSLQQRLAHAREQFASIERAAVADAVEFILQTLEVAPPLEHDDRHGSATATAAIQTDDTQSQETSASPVDAAASLPALQLEYESHVERLRVRNLEVVRSKTQLAAAKAEHQTLVEHKRAAKAAIKMWLADFERTHGREPTLEDKAQVKDLYVRFKTTEEAANSKKADVAALKAAHQAIVAEVEAIAKWQALGGTLVRDSEASTEHRATSRSDASNVYDDDGDFDEDAESSRALSRVESPAALTAEASASAPARPDSATSREMVTALEREVERLRQELASVKTSQVVPDDGGSSAEAATNVEDEAPELDFGEADASGDAMDAPSDDTDVRPMATRATDSAVETASVERQRQLIAAIEAHEQQLEVLQQEQTRVTSESEQQRSSLEATMAHLTHEIETRQAEKAALETQIEQLRLHLELMELSHDSSGSALQDDDNGEDGDDRASAQAMLVSDEKPIVTRRVSQNAFFDDAEDVESGDDEDEEEGGRDEHKRDAKDAKREALDDDDEDADALEQESESADESADAKDAVASVEDVKDTESASEKEDFMSCLHVLALIRDAIEQGKAQFNRGDKAKCYQTYVRASEQCVDELKSMHASRRDAVLAFKQALSEASRLPPARGSVVLRKQLDELLADCEKQLREREERAAAQRKLALERSLAAKATAAPAKASAKRATSPKKPSSAHHTKGVPLDRDDGDVTSASSVAASPVKGVSGAATPVANTRATDELKQKLKTLEARAKADRVKITQLEAALAKTETQLSSGGSNASSGASGASAAVLERKIAEIEKKHKHALEDAEKGLKREIAALTQQLQAATTKSTALQDQVAASQKELAQLGGKATQLSKLEDEMVGLKQQAAQASVLADELSSAKMQCSKLEASYKEEQALRKKYYNMIEDMKGKIRVYARCRPMSHSELERGCQSCVKFVDEFSLELATARGPKAFAYDQVFSPASSQDAVFEDTKNLLQSAVDGYNVCIFAYGQTGSGKTFTMTGTESMPGLSPRAIAHLFALADDAKSNHTITFHATMLELYNDNLIDLFHLVDAGHDRDAALAGAHKLEIKKNDKGLVFVQNAVAKACTSPQQTLKLFDAANKKRQVGSTKMNAESSRSHSVFSIVIESYNKTTKATTIGKLSLVDLAGSERAGKTGATAERLKEAQAINKSLSGASWMGVRASMRC